MCQVIIQVLTPNGLVQEEIPILVGEGDDLNPLTPCEGRFLMEELSDAAWNAIYDFLEKREKLAEETGVDECTRDTLEAAGVAGQANPT